VQRTHPARRRYVFNEAKGDPEFPVAAGTPFKSVADDYQCPVCGANKNLFVSKSKVVAGFAENQGAPKLAHPAARRCLLRRLLAGDTLVPHQAVHSELRNVLQESRADALELNHAVVARDVHMRWT
jgi:rubredoxin